MERLASSVQAIAVSSPPTVLVWMQQTGQRGSPTPCHVVGRIRLILGGGQALPPKEMTPGRRRGAMAEPNTPHVLVVDAAALRGILGSVLQQAGFRVTLASVQSLK